MFGEYVPSVAKDDADPLERWRHFEQRYAESVAIFLREGAPPPVAKDEMIELASLRSKADRWRDRYFKRIAGVKD